MIFGLIASAGLRASEVSGLHRSDVYFERGLLHIRHNGFGKSRWAPLHPTTTQALHCYPQQRDQDPLAASTEAFFVFDYGRPATTLGLEYAFKLLRQKLQWHSRGGHPVPRIYDLRHITSLAANERLGWQEETRYGRRSLAETTMGSYKAIIIGPQLRARCLSGQRSEAAIGVAVLNRMLEAGRPKSACSVQKSS